MAIKLKQKQTLYTFPALLLLLFYTLETLSINNTSRALPMLLGEAGLFFSTVTTCFKSTLKLY